jgi:error-prone DNA polymerase
MNMLPRLKPKEFYDLVIQVAIVRPGPIQGNMVHPYLRRRSGAEKVSFPSPSPKYGPRNELHQVLHRTLGVPLFQEQAMKLAMVAAEFTDEEANRLRRAMATFRNVGTIGTFETMMVERMVKRGYERDFAQRCFEQIKGFGSYGFPESHAASFAKLVYISSFIKRRHPAVFACALLNSQPMGFYAPAQIVRDAQEHKVEVRGVDINHSAWDHTLERAEDGKLALRLGLRQVEGLAEVDGRRLVDRRSKPYESVEDLSVRARLFARPMRLLADADAFRSLGLDRREALWSVRRLPDVDALPLFAAADAPELGDEPDAHLPAMALPEHIAADYQTLHLSLKGHPMEILRPIFESEGVLTCTATSGSDNGKRVRTAGVVLVRQRPGTGNASFMTLEDETDITNVVLWVPTFEKFRREVMGARLLLVEGKVQKSPEGVVHLMAEKIFDRSAELCRLSDDHETRAELSRADVFLHSQTPRNRHPRDVRILPKSRDFH